MDSRYAPASEASSLPLKSPSPDTAALPPSKTTRKPPKGSSSVSRKRTSSETFYSSMEDPSVVAWIASLPASHASRIVLPESARERMTSAGSGQTSPESSVSPIQVLSLSKTLRGSLETATPAAVLKPNGWMTTQASLFSEEWEPFSGIWPKWGLCVAGEVYELPTWAPATAGRESSFWPTAMADESAAGPNNHYRGDPKAGRQLTTEAEDWSTPQAHDSTGRRSVSATLADSHYYPHDLCTEAETWRAPDAQLIQVGLWRTPQAGHQLKGGSQPPEKRLAGGHNLDLQDQAEYWMTPNVPNGGRKLSEADCIAKGATDKGKRQVGLENQAEFWLSRLVHPIQDGLTFSVRVRILLRLCRQLRQRLPSPYNKARSIFKRKLNPSFVDWLMGWPDGWSSEGRVFSAEEMASYLSAQRQHLWRLLSGLDYLL